MERSLLKLVVFLFTFALIAPATFAAGKTVDILVADKKSDAYKNAKAKANDDTIFAERKLHKAFSQAEKLIRAKKKCPQPRHPKLPPPKCNLSADERELTINIKVAHGNYAGKGGKGGFGFSEMIAPDTTLRILGGYNDDFTKRAPFDTPSVIDKAATAISFAGKKHALKELVISGFVFNAAAGNAYDAKTNSLLKGKSAEVRCITLGYLTTERLEIADNVFLNSSLKAMAPLIRAKDANAEVIVRNNFILNNVLAWEADSARYHQIPKRYVIEGNSFILNWPFNPDPTTGNPAALQLAGKYATKKFVIKGNLFAHNVGGAIFSTNTSDKNPPPIEIEGNLFFHNGALFGEPEPGAAVMVAKFGGFKSRDIPWNTIDLETLEDDYEWDSEDNVALDPKITIPKLDMLFADSNKVGAANTKANAVRGMLGQNKQGGTVAIKDFAPRWDLDLAAMPFPKEAKAKKYGVSRERVKQY